MKAFNPKIFLVSVPQYDFSGCPTGGSGVSYMSIAKTELEEMRFYQSFDDGHARIDEIDITGWSDKRIDAAYEKYNG